MTRNDKSGGETPGGQEAPAVIVGSGISGLRLALYLAEDRPVVILTKKEAVESNTNYAQGGVAAALGEDDTVELHVADTLRTSAGLSDPEVVRIVVTEGPDLVRELVALGANFARDGDGGLALGREGGHSRNRVVHAADTTGREIERVLLAAVEAHPRIELKPFHLAIDLIVRDGRADGVIILDPDGALEEVPAALVCLSTGGLGRVYKYTTNPEIATGDGLAIGYRAGATLRDLEFIQFHPTALARPGAGSFLISEAVRGEGGILKTIAGERFMRRYAPELLDLAPRDVVARAIDSELKRNGDPHVLLHVDHLGGEFLRKRFPTIHATCRLHGIEIERMPIPVVPAAHYSCGGLMTDLHARTSIPGLYSVGETASHGLHGANRLASNSLLEALVFARRAALAAAAEPRPAMPDRSRRLSAPNQPSCGLTSLYSERLAAMMTQSVGVFRRLEALENAAAEAAMMADGVRRLLEACAPTRELIELANMIQCAELILRSCRARRESRGLHTLEDHPGRNAEAVHTLITNESPRGLLPFFTV